VLKKKLKENLLFIFKIILSLSAIYYVLKKVSPGDIAGLLQSAKALYLLPALFLFAGSKFMSASRALLMLNHYSIPISAWENLKLYWTGMFYNLFLPGGIGGDIYKTAAINKIHNDGLKISVGVVLMDRVAGVAALIILALGFIPFINLYHWGWVSIIGILLTIIGFVGSIIIFMPGLKEITGKLLGWSFMVQIFQILSILFIMKAIGVKANFLEYVIIFLLSSIAAMLPISIGGIGIREMVFFSFSGYFFLDQKVAVSISFSFYLITLLASSPGIFSALEGKRKSELKTDNILIK
jgi:uncharacterized membrane protein YbhN (UPF0104 family)